MNRRPAHPINSDSVANLDGTTPRGSAASHALPAAYPKDKCIHELFAECAQRAPHATALIQGHRTMTYGELDRRSFEVASELLRRGAEPDVPVCVFLDRSFELIVGLLGVLKAGAAYLPLDPGYPELRLAKMLEGTGARIGLTGAGFSRRLPPQLEPVVVDGDVPLPAASRQTAARISPANLAYVMYTSGSTGQPKRVGVTHQNVVRLVRNTNYVDISEDDAFLQLAPATFDASTFEIWGALLNGARLVLYPASPLDLAVYERVVSDAGISIAWLTAGLFHRIVEDRPQALGSIRQLLAGGDVLSPALVRRAMAGGTCRVINGYGPTECTTFSVCHRVREPASLSSTVPIGVAVSNTSTYVLDESLAPVAHGQVGELYIGGDGVARGYIDSASATATRFIPDPFRDAGDRMYRTGDLVRAADNGELEFLGRIDRQLKVRGFRIEPAEVESVLMAHPAIQQAIVVALEDVLHDKRLVAFVRSDDEAVDGKAIRNHVKEALPPFMVPSHVEFVSEFPLTENGKIDRERLPKLEWAIYRPRPTLEPTLVDQA